MKNRSFDFVVFGATGFTGGLTADYLAQNAPVGARWALAGRNRQKLEAVRARLAKIRPDCSALDLLVVDATDATALKRVAESTRVVVTTVGPYILHGEPLVAACAAAGTHYCDLTGEPEFVDQMWLAHHAIAEASGAKLVHCCGFDSIPHDLGAYFTVLQLPENVPLTVKGYVQAKGSFSAGTYHSALNAFARIRQYPAIQRLRKRRDVRAKGRKISLQTGTLRFHKGLNSWVAPMPTIDPKIVAQSAVAMDRYGPNFSYGHFAAFKHLTSIGGLAVGVSALMVGAQFKLSREWLMARKVSGEGPSPEQREKAWFRVRFEGEGGGKRVLVDVKGGDPGYGDTAKMLAESTLALAYDHLPARAGQLSPAAAMGDALLERLPKAGITFSVVAA